MATSISLKIQAEGASEAQRAVQGVTQAAEGLQKVAQPSQNTVGSWNAYITALRAVEAANRSATDAANQLDAANQAIVTNSTVNNLQAQVTAAREYDAAMQQATAATKRFNEEQAKTREVLGLARNVGVATTAAGAGGLALLTNAAFHAGDNEKTLIALERVEGSLEAAKARMKEFEQLARETGTSVGSLVQQAQALAGMGFAPDEWASTIRILGDAMAGTGQGGDALARVSVNLAQIRGSQHPATMDLRQFVYAGLDVEKITSTGLGKDVSLEEIQKLSGGAFVDAFLKGLEEMYGGALAAQSGTLPGTMASLAVSIERLNVAVGGPIAPTITMIANAVSSAADAFTNLHPAVQGAVSWTVAIVSTLLVFTGTLVTVTAQVGLANMGLQSMGMKTIPQLIGGIRGVLPALGSITSGLGGFTSSIGGLTTSIGTATGALGGLATFLSVALPVAIAAGAALLIKKWQDSLADAEDARAEGRDNPVNTDALAKAQELGGSKTREGLLAQADEIAVRRQKAEEIASQEMRWQDRWGITGSGRYANEKQRSIEDAKVEAQSLRMAEERLRRQAAQAPSRASLGAKQAAPGGQAAASVLSSMGAGGSGGSTDAEIQQLEAEIIQLTQAMKAATEEEKKELSSLLAQKKIALKAAKSRSASERKLAAQAEREAQRAEREAIAGQQMEFDVREAQEQERFETRIAQLELERDKAREESNTARVAALENEIEQLRINRDYSLAKIRADQTALTDERRADSMRRIAEIRKKGAQERAAMALKAAQSGKSDNSGVSVGGVLPGLPANLSPFGVAGSGGGMFNPYANTSYDGAESPFVSTISSRGSVFDGIGSFLKNQSDKVRKIRHSQSQTNKGKLRFEFEPIEIDDPVLAMGARV